MTCVKLTQVIQKNPQTPRSNFTVVFGPHYILDPLVSQFTTRHVCELAHFPLHYQTRQKVHPPFKWKGSTRIPQKYVKQKGSTQIPQKYVQTLYTNLVYKN